jgi:hypothetical protein
MQCNVLFRVASNNAVKRMSDEGTPPGGFRLSVTPHVASIMIRSRGSGTESLCVWRFDTRTMGMSTSTGPMSKRGGPLRPVLGVLADVLLT